MIPQTFIWGRNRLGRRSAEMRTPQGDLFRSVSMRCRIIAYCGVMMPPTGMLVGRATSAGALEVHGFGGHVGVLEAGAGVEEDDFVGGFEFA